MGIFCYINLHKPEDELFVAGSTVSGVIRYAVDEEMTLNRITISLKVFGKLEVKRGSGKDQQYYHNNEKYVDVDNVIEHSEKGLTLPIGSYETAISFQLPSNIPSSMKYNDLDVACIINYYVRIKFDRSGFMKLAKRFKKEITIRSAIIPKFLSEPLICAEQKSLTQLFSSKSNLLNIKATIINPIIKPGGKAVIHYEITNDSNKTIKIVDVKLKENYRFRAPLLGEYDKSSSVKGIHSTLGTIESGNTISDVVEVDIIPDIFSIDKSLIVSRDYFVRITCRLSVPHRNMVLMIPIQVGCVGYDNHVDYNSDDPPSYWEAMMEGEKNDLDAQASGFKKGEKS